MRALITGVSRGIGRSLCLQLAADGIARGDKTRIAAAATGKSDDVHRVVEELKEMGAEAVAVLGDLTDADDTVRVAEEALAFCGGLDALVNNAGFPILGTLREVKVRHWDRMFGINVRSTLLLGRTAYEALKASKGAICAIASGAAEMVSPGLTGYSPSKAALVMLTRQMAYEWGPDGIRVNCVSPGMTHSRSTETWTDDGVAFRSSRVPLRRLAEPEDVARAVSFLCDPRNGYITGENLNVDGGVRFMAMDHVIPPGPRNYNIK